jgi:hypothetical protein
MFWGLGTFGLKTVRGFLLGAFIASLGWFTWFLAERYSGSGPRLMGAEAEKDTAKILERLKDHHIVHGLEFEGRDVDHVVIGSSGVFAIETKWTGVALDSPLGKQVLKGFLARAHWGAGRIKALLNAAGQRTTAVQPVLVIWGPGTWSFTTEIHELEGVLICPGHNPERLLTTFESHVLEPDVAEAAAETVRGQEERQLQFLARR